MLPIAKIKSGSTFPSFQPSCRLINLSLASWSFWPKIERDASVAQEDVHEKADDLHMVAVGIVALVVSVDWSSNATCIPCKHRSAQQVEVLVGELDLDVDLALQIDHTHQEASRGQLPLGSFLFGGSS